MDNNYNPHYTLQEADALMGFYAQHAVGKPITKRNPTPIARIIKLAKTDSHYLLAAETDPDINYHVGSSEIGFVAEHLSLPSPDAVLKEQGLRK